MKICKRLLCGSLALLTILLVSPLMGQQIGDGVFNPGGVQPYFADINVGWPGRVWMQASLADQGLGYQGSYFTLGAKTHAFQDFLDGRWLVEGRGHISAESGGFFGNIGLERVFTLEPAEAEITTSIWYDYDSDLQGDFSHAMNGLGVSAGLKKRNCEILANGYWPVGENDYLQGDPTGAQCFLNHSIVVQAGIDSALKGFDAIVRFKPNALAQVNGSFGVGGYNYGSDVVDYFGGVRLQAGLQLQHGMIVNMEINHDNRFDVTGVLQLGWLFGGGAGGRGTEYGLLGTDLQPTMRNDHIVRFQQDLMLAIDPDTGRPYNVYHVDNLADATIEDGTFETPFDSLADAEAASSADDIIFVNPGDGTVRNMDAGIVLKDGQLLLGNGVQQIIPLAGGTNFVLCNRLDGNVPRITNRFGGNAVTLANRNTVRGFIIDGSQGGMVNGIGGNGLPFSRLTDGIIEDVTITGSPILNGIFLNQIDGDWTFARNNIQTASFDGIFIDNAGDASSVFEFDSNIVSNNSRDGIHMEDYDGTFFRFVNNTTSNNMVDGITMLRYQNGGGSGGGLDFINPVALANQSDGIMLDDFVGDVRFLNSNVQNNINNGIALIDVRTPGISDQVFIGTSGAGTSVISGNGVGTGSGIFNQLNTAFGVERLLVTDTTLDNGGTGITSDATAIGANLNTELINNNSISGNQSDAIRLMSSGGATHTATVVNTGGALAVNNNTGHGISLYTAGAGPVSLLEVDTFNVQITGSGANGMLANIIEDGQIISRTGNVTITGTGADGVQINANNDNSIAVSEFSFDNMNISGVADDGIDLNIGDQTFADFTLTNSVLNNNFTGNNGLEIDVTGDALAGVDTRFRMNLVGNTINAFDSGQGVDIVSRGDAIVLAQIEGNTITNNGINQVATGVPTVPFGAGINIVAADDSEIFTRILNNNITQNADQGVDITTLGNGQVTALVANNFIAFNDTQDDGNTVPIEAFNFDMTATNSVTGQICLAMSTNLFNLPVVLDNILGGPANFRVELDGLTNGIGVPVFVPNLAKFTILPYGSACALDIDAEELIFTLNGFSPWP